MNKTVIVLVIISSMLVLGCVQSGPPTGYAGYGGGYQGGHQAQGGGGGYVGYGCGVSSDAPYEETPAIVPVNTHV